MCRPKLPNVFAPAGICISRVVSRENGDNAFMTKDGGEVLKPVRPY